MASWVSPRLTAADTGVEEFALSKYEASIMGCQARFDQRWFLKSYFTLALGQYVGLDWERSLIISIVSLASEVFANCWNCLGVMS